MSNAAYNHKKIEESWQKKWKDTQAFKFENENLGGRRPYYVLEMFPYPSGKIHMGHVRNYTIGDVIARVRSMQGYKVLHPMGFDAFGLPAENAAIETKSHPQQWTLQNIEQMKTTIKKLGFSYDWDREIATCLPSYYKHEQEMFIKFYEAGLAYQKKSFVNWDPVDNTVLANEQVIDGKGWRSGAKVERKELKQWFLKVSNFAEDLLSDLDTLNDWPEKVKLMQRNWIGKSTGAEVSFKLDTADINFYTNLEIQGGMVSGFETKNLKARKLTKDDFDLLYSLHSNQEVMKNIGNGKSKSKQEVEQQLANIILNPQNAVFAIFEKQTNKFIGRAGFSTFNSIIKSDVDIDGYELGYCLMPEFWGKGHSRELCLVIIDLFFNKLKVDSTLYAKATDRNDRSINNLLALSFVRQKSAKSDMQSLASIYALQKNDWNNFIQNIKVFTTRPDTLHGASFIALSAFHPLINALYPLFDDKIHAFLEKQKNIKVSTQDLETLEKEGVFTGLYVNHPLASVANSQNGEFFDYKLNKIPVYIANFVLMDYGTGGVFGCPAHDERDFEFAAKYNLAIPQVVADNSNTICESKRLSFSPVNADNISDINNLHRDKDVTKYLDGYCHNGDEYTKHNKNKKINLAIYSKQTAEFIGRGGIYNFLNLDGQRHTKKSLYEISYIFSKNNWGNGYGSEAAKILSHFCFTNLAATEICAVIDSNHLQSRKILEKIGFTHISTKHVNDIYGSESYFELTKQKFYSSVNIADFLECRSGLGFAINCPLLDGLTSADAKEKMIKLISSTADAKQVTNYKLRDWGVSRQRYWGCPIPMIHCQNCGTVSERIENLPVELPEDVDLTKSGSPLDNHPTWKKCKCPKCGGNATRETDTFDTFFESSWYFLRFLYPQLETAGFDSKTVDKFLPVNEYIGGIEHAILHLLYARFFVKALKKINLLKTSEPFKRLITQGMICHKTYKNKQTGKWISPEDAKNLLPEQVEIGDSIKMSKSKKNIVDPENIIELHGADTARLFVLSDSPPEKDIDWSEEGVSGCNKFIKRFYAAAISFAPQYKHIASKINDQQIAKTKGFFVANKYLVEYLEAFDGVILNKCVAKCRELFNTLTDNKIINEDEDKFVCFNYLIQMLNPIIPHTCEQIWHEFGNKTSLTNHILPQVDKNALESNTIKIAVQVNGKMRGSVEVKINAEQDAITKIATQLESVKNQLCDKQITKTIFVPNKIINFICS